MNPRRLVLLFVLIPALALLASGPARSADEAAPVYVVSLSGPIAPGSAGYLVRALDVAAQNRAACLVIRLDTPGGLVDSMRVIVQKILASPVPVVVYVAPAGARAASAGVLITLAADVAAMAEGTNIGAAHPVGAGGVDIGEAMEEKVVNDMAAQARTLAEQRGRNAQWAEEAVRQSVSATVVEALEKNVVDLMAVDLADLLEKIHGREIPGKGTLSTQGAPVRQVEASLRERFLMAVSNPNLAYILMIIGLAGLYFEFTNPGAVVPGVLGGISLILGFYSLSTLPVNYAGALLILLSVVFFILEVYVTSHGVLALGGVASLVLGSLMLFDRPATGIGVQTGVLVSSIGSITVFVFVVSYLVVRARLSRPRTGSEGMVGKLGVVKQVGPEPGRGKVQVFGELWNARFSSPMEVGDAVRVRAMEGLSLLADPEREAAGTGTDEEP
ncbi:MAG: nodulation protein NfeD [Proteobacteria bacterium]|nr:nodulation protein NfeD [Pseudomonadota bacterium]